jgi:ferrochelatase
MAHGTPGNADEIAAFYTRIRRGRPPDAAQLAELEGRYRAIGGVSPLAERTRAQVTAVRAELERRGPGRYVVSFGAKHTDPLIEKAAAELATAGHAQVVGLVLTPHASSMGSQEYLDRAAAELGATPFVAIGAWYGQPALIDLLASRVTAALGKANGRKHVIFTAHSLPERIRDSGDTYPEQVAESAALVARRAGLDGWSVAWQSAGRTPEPWLGPDVRDVVRQLGADAGTDTVVVCPIGFVADHLEVLYDLDIEVSRVAAEAGLEYARTASLNNDPALVEVLADLITAATS